MEKFKLYQKWFEAAIATAVSDKVVGKMESVPVLSGKLAKTNFGKRIGLKVDSNFVFAINYYGLFKKSNGFMSHFNETRGRLKGRQIKTISAPVVHFSSLKLEDLAKIDPNLLTQFAEYKNMILVLRGFKK